VLKGGASLTISTGERLKLSPQDVEVPQVYTAQSGATDCPLAIWRPAASCNYTDSDRETSYDVRKIVIHVAEGSYSGTISWFENRSAQASAHYVVSREGRVARCVRRGHRLARRLVGHQHAQHRHRARGLHRQPGVVYPEHVPYFGEAFGVVLQDA
jgi:hypothetical protein